MVDLGFGLSSLSSWRGLLRLSSQLDRTSNIYQTDRIDQMNKTDRETHDSRKIAPLPSTSSTSAAKRSLGVTVR